MMKAPRAQEAAGANPANRKSFVDDVPQSSEDVAIIAAILSLAGGLDLVVVAEGVENTGQLEFLKKKGCDLIRGYLTGRPVSSEVFHEKYVACLCADASSRPPAVGVLFSG